MSASDPGPLAPVLVAVLVVVILVVIQPLQTTIGGVSMNWVGAAVVLIGGILGASNS
jgi:type IV secretory pathway VirB2 component (pilin)